MKARPITINIVHKKWQAKCSKQNKYEYNKRHCNPDSYREKVSAEKPDTAHALDCCG